MTVAMPTTARRDAMQARRRQRRGELLSAAMDVIRRGGADATMEQMASAGGISKPILYRHFSDRDGLVGAITDDQLDVLWRLLDERLESVTGNWRDTVRATIDAFFEYIEREPALYRFIIEHNARQASPATHAFIEKVAAHVAGVIANALDEAGLDTGPATVWGRAIVGMVQSTGDWWVSEGCVIPRVAVVDSLTELAWAGIRGGPHRDAEPATRIAPGERSRSSASSQPDPELAGPRRAGRQLDQVAAGVERVRRAGHRLDGDRAAR